MVRDGDLGCGNRNVPFVDRLVQAQQNEVEVLQDRPLFHLVPEEHVYRVREGR